MQESLSPEILKQICKFGTYYNPARKHYNNGQNVICDRCRRDDLDICIGYEKYDLCFNCVQEVVRMVRPIMKRPLEEYGPTASHCKHPQSGPISRMMPNQFNK